MTKWLTLTKKGKEGGGGVKGSIIEDFIFYLSHKQTVLSRETYQKSLVRG
jgi:hypothetical protein